MDFDALVDSFITEAAKMLHMDQSMAAFHQKMQDHVRTEHRVKNAASDAYYDYPYVRDVFGDQKKGAIIYAHKGQNYMADYDADDKGGITLKNHKKAKQSYVADGDADDSPLTRKYEAAITPTYDRMEETTILQESKGSGATVKLKLIAPGTGSMGHYTAEALKKASTDKIFHKGIQMFLDHPTEEERKRSGTGSVKNLAAVLASDATYEENGQAGPGLYADAKVFTDKKDFISERKNDIGISVAVGVKKSGKQIDGVPVVESMVRALSCDFVSAAGAGGKLVEMYESYREKAPESKVRGEEIMDDKQLNELREAAAKIPALVTRIDRLEEENSRLKVRGTVTDLVAESKLPVRAQARVVSLVTSSLALKDGKVEDSVIKEAVKAAVQDETDYLKEAGYKDSKVVRLPGSNGQADEGDDNVKAVQESAKLLEDNIKILAGTAAKK